MISNTSTILCDDIDHFPFLNGKIRIFLGFFLLL